jgi:chromosome segregation ATPase
MGNIRLLTSGLVIVVLGLAGGTGYLVYENIQSELGGRARVTHEDMQQTRNEIKQTQEDVLGLKEQQQLHTAQIKAIGDQVDVHQVRIDRAEQTIKNLEQQAGDNAAAIEHAKRERDQLKTEQAEMRETLEDHQQQLDDVNQKLTEMGEKVQDLERRVVDNESRITSTEERLEEKDRELQELREEFEELKRQLGIRGPERGPEN